MTLSHVRFVAALGLAVIAAWPALAQAESTPAAQDPAKLEFFEKKIRPLLVDNCYNCHSANTNARGGLRVDDHGGLLSGGNSGAAIIPGNAADSILIQAVKYDGFEMPPKKRLSDEQIADLVKWVEDGAAWPKSELSVPIDKPNAKYEQLKKEHWAWQPLQAAKAPEVKSADWPRDDVDRFVAAKLEANNLKPASDADKLTLLRRVTFDLTGLPPTPEEIDVFIADDSTDAYEKVVDRLLASPAFGERWGRHWLDVARYGESTGSSRNVPYPQAWRYRDYVIDSFNKDKPYDQFIREQIAGDLLPAESDEQREEQLIATGFLALGVKDVNQRFKVRFTMDNIDEQIDTVSRSVLALTASCARCHDHKFDPIPTRDYYALAGIFNSTDLCAGVRNKMGGSGLDYYDTAMLIRLGDSDDKNSGKKEEIEKLKKQVAEAKAKFEALRDSPEGAELNANGRPKRQAARQRWNRLQQDLAALTDPAVSGKVTLGVREAKTIGDTEIRIRGEAEKLGPVAPRGFLSVLEVPNTPTISAGQSGRLELAQWLTSPQNPLTSRVIVNRAWHHLFGHGLVSSVDNFGVTGDSPTHPELLDHLAQRFVNDGWSVKNLVRTLVLTRSYQLSAEAFEPNVTTDPANKLVWRHTPRRLAAEEIRDATLVATGKLQPGRPENTPVNALKVIEIRNNGQEAKQIATAARSEVHRSIYLPLLRDLTPTSLGVFDFAEQGMVSGSRETTTVATQALYLLNDPFVRRQALELATDLLSRADLDDAARLRLAYRRALGRTATESELERAVAYLAEFEAAAGQALPEESEPVVIEVAKQETAPAENTAGTTQTPVIDPDQVITPDVPLDEEVIQAPDAKSAAWASFCQALLGSAEFRYLK